MRFNHCLMYTACCAFLCNVVNVHAKEEPIRLAHYNYLTYLEHPEYNLKYAIEINDADVVCLRNISLEDANRAYEALRSQYAQFLFLEHSDNTEQGTFFASNYEMENVQFNPSSDTNRTGSFEFAIKTQGEYRGKVYINENSSTSPVLLLSHPYSCGINSAAYSNDTPYYTLCGNNQANASASVDNEGNLKVEVGVSNKQKDEDGSETSYGIKGIIERDENGEIKSKAEVEWGHKWHH